MAEPHLDHPGETTWYAGFGPAPVLGPCPHPTCPHNEARTVAHGPDFRRYTLDQCSVKDGCNGACRARHDERCRPTTAWLSVQPNDQAAPMNPPPAGPRGISPANKPQ